jgi:CHAT domain-containing protein/tetratricopeptide (TPR) repeat protein
MNRKHFKIKAFGEINLYVCFIRINLIVSILLGSYESFSQEWQYYDSLRQVSIEMKDIENAERYAGLSIEKYSFAHDTINIEFADLLYKFTDILISQEKYSEAEILCFRDISIRRKLFDYNNESYTQSLANLALIYNETQEYAKSEPILLELLSLYEELFEKKSINYVNTLNDLGYVNRSIGNFRLAEFYYAQCVSIAQELYGRKNINYAIVISNLAGTYRKSGDYSKAEPLLLEASEIIEELYGSNHVYYATILNNTAQLYLEIGQLERAEKLLEQAHEIVLLGIVETDPIYSQSLNNLASIYIMNEKYDEAIELLEKSAKIRLEIYGDSHNSYAETLNSCAILYSKKGDIETAEKYYLETYRIFKNTRLDNPEKYAISLTNLGDVYRVTGNYELSEKYFREAIDIQSSIMGGISPEYINTRIDMLLVLYATGRISEAVSELFKIIPDLNQQLKNQIGFLSENEMNNYLKRNLFKYNFIRNFCLKNIEANPELVGAIYDIELNLKAMLLNSGIQMRQSIIDSNDTVLINIYERWIELRSELTGQYLLHPDKRNKNTVEIENEINSLEKQLVRGTHDFVQSMSQFNVGWKDVQSKLADDEVCVEFVSFPEYDGTKLSDYNIYAALILRKDFEFPKMVYLCNQADLERIMNPGYFGSIDSTCSKHNDRGVILMRNKQNNLLYDEIYKIIWLPLEELLKNVKKVYLSPSGLLHKISFVAVKDLESKYLSERFELIHLVSSAELVTGANKSLYINSDDRALIVGGIDFNKSSSLTNNDSVGNKINIDSRYKDGYWNYLEGTMTEAIYIDSIFRINNIKSDLTYGENATEELFKSYSGNSHQIIHIATHGFFFQMAEQKTYNDNFNDGQYLFRQASNPLLRSGLLFAGANYLWRGGKVPFNVEDGILTAYEVSNLNLNNTKLVILSACETGLGEISDSEGVYGLQRAFKIAGAEYIIMSLWQVPDKETAEFMQLFYSYCMQHCKISDAFRKAQADMRVKYEDFYWAAFVLVE